MLRIARGLPPLARNGHRVIPGLELRRAPAYGPAMRWIAPFVALSLAACAPWPDLGEAEPRGPARDWPALLPLETVLTGTAPALADEATGNDLADRAAALRARAAILRGDASDLDALRAAVPR